jgi:hypothetical protein
LTRGGTSAQQGIELSTPPGPVLGGIIGDGDGDTDDDTDDDGDKDDDGDLELDPEKELEKLALWLDDGDTLGDIEGDLLPLGLLLALPPPPSGNVHQTSIAR